MQNIHTHQLVQPNFQIPININFTYDHPFISNYRTSQFSASQSQGIKIKDFKSSMWSFGRNEGSLGWRSDRYGEKDRQGKELRSKEMRKFKIFEIQDKEERGSFGQNYDRLANCSKNGNVKNGTANLIAQRNSQNLEAYINLSKIKPLLNLNNKSGKSQKQQFTSSRYFDQNQDETNLESLKLGAFKRKTQTVAFVALNSTENMIQKLQDFTSSTSMLSETLCEEDIIMIESTLKRLDSGQQKLQQFNMNSQQKVYLTFSLLLFLLTVLLSLFIAKT